MASEEPKRNASMHAINGFKTLISNRSYLQDNLKSACALTTFMVKTRAQGGPV